MADADVPEGSFVRDLLRTTARKYLEEQVPLDLVAAEADTTREPDHGPRWASMVDMGWTAIPFPEEAGGSGLGLAEQAVLFEELGRALCPGPYFSSMALAAPLIADQPDVARRVIDGSAVVTVAWAEPDGCQSLCDLTAVTCRAEQRAGTWTVRGVKVAVPDASAATEAVVVASGPDGPGLFIVGLIGSGATIEPVYSLDGTRRSYRVVFDDASADLLAGPEQAARLLARARSWALTAAAYEGIGVGARVLNEIVDYAGSRYQFRKPIGSFQAVSGPLADAYVEIELARALAEWAVRAVDADDPDAAVAASAAKAAGAEVALRTVERAIQVAGAIGFTWEYHLHRFLRRGAWLNAFEGGASLHRAAVAGALLDRSAAPRSVELLDDEEAAAFRSSVRQWVDENLPTAERGAALVRSLDAYEETKEAWRRELCATGNLVAHWPVEYGGRGAPDVVTAIFREEALRAHPRVSHGDCGVDLVAPLLMRYGTEEQKERYLEPIRTEREIWAQGFSEPDAGSDLASLATRAVEVGDEWVLNGTKTWSTYSPVADWLLVLARTDPEATRHRGISCFLVDARSPGIEIRPIRDIAGTLEFGEVFFTDVHVPAANMLGGRNEGWSVAIATLAHERVIESYEDIGELGFVFDRLLDLLRERPAGGVDARLRDRVASLWCRLQAVRLVQYQCVLALDVSGVPPTQSEIVKLVWSEVAQEVTRLGVEEFATRPPESEEADTVAAFWHWWYLVSRSLTIYAGTSEIIRSVVAERVLGLPRSR